MNLIKAGDFFVNLDRVQTIRVWEAEESGPTFVAIIFSNEEGDELTLTGDSADAFVGRLEELLVTP